MKHTFQLAVWLAGASPVPAEAKHWVLRDHHGHLSAVLLGKSKHYWTGCVPVLMRDFDVLSQPIPSFNT
jgi:hypothetical protein